MRSTAPIIIRLVQCDKEQQKVIDFIDQKYIQLFNTTPPMSDVYFIAKQKDNIVGCSSLDFCDENGLMPISKIYNFNHASAPFSTIGNKGAQYGKWIVTIPYISGALLYIATTYALYCKKEYGWCEHTDAVHKIAERLGVSFLPILHAQLQIENVTEKNRVFYNTAEPMRVYMMNLHDMKKGLETKVKRLIQTNRIVVQSL